MIELLSLYAGAILAGMLCATALALLGCHLVSRDQSLQSLVVSQAATVGVLLGAVLAISRHSNVNASPVPLITGIAAAAMAYLLGEKLTATKRASKTGIYLALFIMLLAMSYWLISYFPALESHMSQAFFGDIVTLSGYTLWFASAVSLLALLSLLVWWKALANHSFIVSVMSGDQVGNHAALHWFSALTLLLISTSIYAMGLLFTIAFLLMPTVTFCYLKVPSVRMHLCLVSLTAAASFGAGFALSLYFDRISMVPTIVLTTGFFGVAVLYIANRLWRTTRVSADCSSGSLHR